MTSKAVASIDVREARGRDRRVVAEIGHPPGVVRTLCPSRRTRLAWWAGSTRVRNFLATDPGTGEVCGSVQLVRSRADPRTWMFGHWRVVAERRRLGIGRALLTGAIDRTPAVLRLYSLVEKGNEVSLEAHRRLGFEEAATTIGTASLGALTTLGPPVPAPRLEPVSRRQQAAFFDLYTLAMGSGWRRLFPDIGPRELLAHAAEPTPAPSVTGRFLAERPARVLCARAAGATLGFAARRGNHLSLYFDPGTCDLSWLARVAQRLVASGLPRDRDASLYGVPRTVVDRAAGIRRWALMTMEDVGRLRSSLT